MSASAASTADAEISTDAAVDKAVKLVPAETDDERWTRRLILLSFWVVIILLGLPFWIWTTTVYRAELPSQLMNEWSDGRACHLIYPLKIRLTSTTLSDDVLTELSSDITESMQQLHTSHLYTYEVSAGKEDLEADLNIDLTLSQATTGPRATLHGLGRRSNLICDDASAACASFAAQHISEVFANERAAIAFMLQNTPYRHLVSSHDAVPTATKTELEQRSIRAFKYASTYHLTFSLFAGTATPSAWEIGPALQRYLDPLLASFSAISNFTIDTQVQLFSSISPSIAGPHYDQSSQSWQLSRSDLSGFINAAEWPLSPSINGGATIDFVLYVPSPDATPLVVADSGRNSWIVPQWGGVQILNRSPSAGDTIGVQELEQVVYTFADQLTALIGLPTQPPSLQLRLDALTRERLTSLILSASSTLGALDKLTKKLQSIAIPVSVAQSAGTTLSQLDQACQDLQAGRFQTALEHARVAEDAAEHAFFEPSMVGQVYFPDEHKVAVYVPLLGPMAVPLLMATWKEIRDLRKRKVKTS